MTLTLPFLPCLAVFNPLSSIVSTLAFGSFGFYTGFLPPLGWT
ncbi:hypothetical protein [Methanocella arvoryzae]|nr:hypothetical protein [Methanocella arvoryzae]